MMDSETIKLAFRDDESYLFLPSNVNKNRIRVFYDNSISQLYIDDVKVSSGDYCPMIATEGEHSIKTQTEELKLKVFCSGEIPAVFIQTESGNLSYIHASKDHSETAVFSIIGGPFTEKTVEYGEIKGRGNTSWLDAKKSYNIKFYYNTNLLGMGYHKKWTLLANLYDPSRIRNALGWFFADRLNLHFSADYRHIDLYFNGIYYGNYILCERVNVDEGRIEIHDLEKDNERINGDLKHFLQIGTGPDSSVPGGDEKGSAKWISLSREPGNVTGGYLLELDIECRYNEDLCGFVSDYGQCVVIKSPEHAGKLEMQYIRDYVNSALNALYSETGYNDEGKHYSYYFDMDSFINMYILQEMSKNLDAGISSLYLYKNQNSLLVFSPVWDMDNAFGSDVERFGTNTGEPDGWWANSLYYVFAEQKNQIPSIFNLAYRHADFREKVAERWKIIRDSTLLEDCEAFFDEISERLRKSSIMNSIVWGYFGTRDAVKLNKEIDDYLEEKKAFIRKRFAALDKGFTNDNVMLYYDANGGSGAVFSPEILTSGESTKVSGPGRGEESLIEPDDHHSFYAWNTQADGNGEYYYPGESIVVESDIVLYAIWYDTSEKESETER